MTFGKIARRPTGIPNLDPLIEGGLPVDSFIVLVTDPDIAAEHFVRQFVYEGLRLGEGIVYCSVVRPPSYIRRDFEYFGLSVESYEKKGQLIFVNSYDTTNHGRNVLNVTSESLAGLSDGINKAIELLRGFQIKRSVCDSTADALLTLKTEHLPDFARSRREVRSSYPMIMLHLMLKGIRDEFLSPLKHHCDGFFELQVQQGPQEVNRFLRIGKMRLTDFPTRLYPLRVTKDRVEVTV